MGGIGNTALFCLYGMSCKMQNMLPPCGYSVDGIEAIRLLDFENFAGFKFAGDGLYSNCYVEGILQQNGGSYIDVATRDTVTKYTSNLQKGVYTHTIETFIGDISAELTASLHLATKRQYIVLFRSKSGRYFVFGYEAGATVSYSSQAADGFGSLVTISAKSIYPLFEKAPERGGNYIEVSPIRMTLDRTSKTGEFMISSSSGWQLISGNTDSLKFSAIQGERGITRISVEGIEIGQGAFIFENEEGQQTAIYIAYIPDRRVWILDRGVWNMQGVWRNDGIWKF